MRVPMRSAWVAAVAVLVVVMTSCGSDGAGSAEASTPSTQAATGTSGTTPSDRVLVGGSGDCGFATGPDEQEKEGHTTIFTGTMTCAEEMSDPRVSGTDAFDITVTYVDDPEMDRFVCENQTLTSEGGTWTGDCYGSEFWTEDGSLFTSGHATLFGQGAYEGLVYHQLYGQSPAADLYLIAGWIEPASESSP